MERTTLYLTRELRRGLEDAARRARRPQAELVREALQQYLDRGGRPRPTFVASVENASVASEDVKTLVRHDWDRRERA